MNRLRYMRIRIAASVLSCGLGVGLSSLAVLSAAQQSEASRNALESAAAKGSVPAQYALGAGAEADGDLSRAATWYRQAAEHGYAAAQFRLCELLERGTDADKAQAIEWYLKAASHGFAQAASRLQELNATTSAVPATPTTPEPAPPNTTLEQLKAAPASEPSRPSIPATGAIVTPTTAPITASSAPSSNLLDRAFDRLESLPEQTQSKIILTVQLALPVYIAVSTFFGWLLMRPVVMRWYRGSDWLVMGRDVKDVFFGNIKMRLQVEGLAVSLGLVVGCFGGNVWFVLSRAMRLVKRKQEPVAHSAEIV